jgi:hypothetical protein
LSADCLFLRIVGSSYLKMSAKERVNITFSVLRNITIA